MSKEETHCCLCSGILDDPYGHNAEPIMTGRCCSLCNISAVIPIRLKLLQISLDKNGGNKSWKKKIK
jgi:hypothetical protein